MLLHALYLPEGDGVFVVAGLIIFFQISEIL
jgi:hypothetical protein